ncbi:hypothetical protein ACQW5G_05115 [Fructilactobacillus sp. Tb1]|uniref:hypothetical protein n=1 Tax=Fructilactobacillus sp. Tb1 TaxID=3422304 RepID=UPI003D2A3153
MIIDVLKDGFKTVKEHKWVILGMWLPSFIVGLIANGFSNSSSVTSAAASATYNPSAFLNAIQGSFFAMIIISLIVTLLKVSLQMGLFQSDTDGKFEFKKAFVGFKDLTWISIIGISFLVGLIGMVFFFIFGIAVAGFAITGISQQNAMFFAIAAAVALIGVAVYAYIALGLYFVYLSYYADTKKEDNGLFKAFPKTWKLMKGHRYQLLGLVVLQALMFVAAVIVFGALSVFAIWLVSLIHVTGFAVALAIILGLVIFVAGLVVFLFFQFWFTMNGIKFFERLNK